MLMNLTKWEKSSFMAAGNKIGALDNAKLYQLCTVYKNPQINLKYLNIK